MRKRSLHISVLDSRHHPRLGIIEPRRLTRCKCAAIEGLQRTVFRLHMQRCLPFVRRPIIIGQHSNAGLITAQHIRPPAS
ncbi:hypothetical protein CI15_33760 [Paraburkholderia monticola]|uniref:Uncharacterized protein n=1 Tax=Paraburkholderia monticola TaxID=1399968 RepID=A0A149PBU6_9BURK|nr:hypothetical protein CI15_33760 [Paraburkholderia monticola]